jgi:hypothetical protein
MKPEVQIVNGMKKGVQYSHYVGGYLQEINNSLFLALDPTLSTYMEGEEAKSEYWAKRATDLVSQLRDKIAELDKLNQMDY